MKRSSSGLVLVGAIIVGAAALLMYYTATTSAQCGDCGCGGGESCRDVPNCTEAYCDGSMSCKNPEPCFGCGACGCNCPKYCKAGQCPKCDFKDCSECGGNCGGDGPCHWCDGGGGTPTCGQQRIKCMCFRDSGGNHRTRPTSPPCQHAENGRICYGILHKSQCPQEGAPCTRWYCKDATIWDCGGEGACDCTCEDLAPRCRYDQDGSVCENCPNNRKGTPLCSCGRANCKLGTGLNNDAERLTLTVTCPKNWSHGTAYCGETHDGQNRYMCEGEGDFKTCCFRCGDDNDHWAVGCPRYEGGFNVCVTKCGDYNNVCDPLQMCSCNNEAGYKCFDEGTAQMCRKCSQRGSGAPNCNGPGGTCEHMQWDGEHWYPYLCSF